MKDYFFRYIHSYNYKADLLRSKYLLQDWPTCSNKQSINQ